MLALQLAEFIAHRRGEVGVGVEEVPDALDAALEGDLVLEGAPELALEVDADAGDVEAAAGGGLVVGGEDLAVVLVEEAEAELELVVGGGEGVQRQAWWGRV